MKKFSLFLLALVCSVGMWATDYEHTFSKTAKTFTADGDAELSEVSWTLATTWVGTSKDYNYDASFGMKLGSNSKAIQTMSLSTSGIEGTISSISVVTNARSGAEVAMSCTVGGTAYSGTTSFTGTGNASTSSTAEFTGSSAGKIVISWDQTEANASKKGAFYVTSITIEYDNGDTRTPVTLTWSAKTAVARIGEEFTAPTLEIDPEGVQGIEYSSSDPEVAGINASTGAITINKRGTTTITASFAGNTIYQPAKAASYTLSVKAPATQSVWSLVTTAPTSWEGEYIIVAKPSNETRVLLNGAQTGFSAVTPLELTTDEFAENGDRLTILTENDPSFTVIATSDEGRYNIKGSGGSWLGGTAGGGTFTNNQSKWVFQLKDAGKIWIRVYATSMDRAILYRNNGTTNTFQHYATSNETTASYYSVYLYKKVADVITISEAKYATYFNATEAYVMPAGLEGITVEGVTNNSTLTLETRYAAGSVVPAGEALILHGEAKNYTLVAGTTANEPLNDNMLKGTSTADEYTEGGVTYYRLSQHEGKVGFYWGAAEGGKFQPGANKAYLALPAGAPARFIFGQQDVPTELQNVSAEAVSRKVMIDGRLYILRDGNLFDLNGRLVK